MREKPMVDNGIAYAALALALVTNANSVAAQTAAPATNPPGEVVVTANKRAEPLRKVPESISVVSGADLQTKKISNFDDLSRSVPNVSVSNSGGPGLGNIEIRGVSSQAGASTTGLYIDDVPINILNLYTTGATEPRFFDMDRVEVLRGPQGTLYGSSSMGGTVRFISNQPVFNEFQTIVHAEVSGTQGASSPNYEASAVVNVPLIDDRAALRVGVDYRQNAGWIDRVSPATGAVVAQAVNRDRIPVIRATLKFEVNDKLTITPSLFAQRYSTTGTSLFNPALPHYQTNVHVAEIGRDEFLAPSLTVRYDLGIAELTSVSSYFARRSDRQIDGTVYDSVYVGSLLDGLYGYGGDAIGALAAPSEFNTRNHRFTQEVRLASKGSSPLSWIVGLYYTHDNEELLDVEHIPGFNTTFFNTYGVTPENSLLGTAFPNDLVFYARSVFKTDEYAAFGDLTYHITPKLKVSAGLRYDIANQTLDFSTTGYLSGGPPHSSQPSHSHSATPKFTIGYDVSSDVTAYANAGKGYRLGGGNRPVPQALCSADLAAQGLTAAPQTFRPDTLWSYEIGAKGRSADHRFTFDVAAYDIEWKGIQEDVLLYGCGFDYKTNVGNARIRGFEATTSYRLTHDLRLDVGGNYTSAILRTAEPQLGIERGDNVIGVPEYSVSIAADYSHTLDGDVTGYLHANYQLIGPSQGAIVHTDPDFRRPSYDVLGGSIGIRRDKFDLSLFATNLLNQAKVIQRPDVALVAYGIRVPPRTIGLAANYQF